MDRLPKEIVLVIINDFSFKEKLACALVCRKWWTWIRDSSLYKTLYFPQHGDNLQKAVAYFNNQNYGHHVRNLQILNFNLDLDQFLNLPGLFPHLKQLKIAVEADLFNEYQETALNSAESDLQIQRWASLESIDEGDNRLYPVVPALLRSPKSVCLTSINLSFPQGSISSNPSKDLLQSIGNAPALQSLVVDCITLSLPDFDSLLEKTPQLKTLGLSNLSIDDENEGSDFSEPKNNLQHLTIDFSPMTNLEFDQWIDYLSLYKSIISLIVGSVDNLARLSPFAAAIESSLIDAFPNWTQLKKYKMGLAPLAEPVLQAMVNNRIELQELSIHTYFRFGTLQFGLLGSSNLAHNIQSLRIVGDSVEYLDQPDVPFAGLMDQMVNLDKINVIDFDCWKQNNPDMITYLIYNAPNVRTMIIPALSAGPPLFNALPTEFTSRLTLLDINYCQFDFSLVDSDDINASFNHALQHCPHLESFNSFVNIYKSIEGTTLGIENTLKFQFSNQCSLKKINISSLYDAYFKIVRNSDIKFYRQSYRQNLVEIPHIDQNCLYITIETNDTATIETVVLD